jgi:hypothetical protein
MANFEIARQSKYHKKPKAKDEKMSQVLPPKASAIDH